MSSRTRRIGFALAAALCCAVAPALAEPKFNSTLSAGTTTFAWEGGPGSGFNKTEALEYTPCGSPNHYCEDVLVKLEVPGQLTAEIKDPTEPADDDGAANAHDLDLQLYESNAAGEPGKQLVATNGTTASEKISKKGLAAGFYVVRVDFYRAVNLSYTGTLAFLPAESAAPATTPPATVAPVAQPVPASKPAPAAKKPSAKTKKKQAACKKKAKKIKSAKKRKAALKRCAKIR